MARQRSRRAVVWAIAFSCLGLPALGGAADLKIGFIDSERIFAEYPGTQEAQRSFNREVQDLTKTAKEKKAEIDDLQRKLDAQGPMLSEAKRDEQNQVLQKKIGDYDAFVQKNWGPQGEVSKMNERFLKPIVDRVHKIVTGIGTDEGYSLVLDRRGRKHHFRRQDSGSHGSRTRFAEKGRRERTAAAHERGAGQYFGGNKAVDSRSG